MKHFQSYAVSTVTPDIIWLVNERLQKQPEKGRMMEGDMSGQSHK